MNEQVPSEESDKNWCACVSTDARTCYLRRYNLCIDEARDSGDYSKCECCCHEYEIEYDDEF